jgi:hypothetical protein
MTSVPDADAMSMQRRAAEILYKIFRADLNSIFVVQKKFQILMFRVNSHNEKKSYHCRATRFSFFFRVNSN